MPVSSVRHPTLAVLAAGNLLAGVETAEIVANSHLGADRFRVALALDANPVALWAAGAIPIEIRIGLDNAWASLLQGNVDHLEIDPLRGTVTLEGRDLTAALIAARTQETFENRTASEIATILAGRHGLAADVTPTSTPVGRYYQSEHDRVTLDQFARATTEWDLLVFLAQHEGFDVWVSGATLYFHPPATAASGALLTPADCIELRLDRALSFAGSIEVVVKSWNSRQKTAFAETASSAGGFGVEDAAAGGVQQYVYVRPNLTPADALQLAQRILAELLAHERMVTATLPGELSLAPRDLLTLAGTGTDFDQTYVICEVERRLSFAEGFVQRVRAKNLAPGAGPGAALL